jgi:hypothetical protein
MDLDTLKERWRAFVKADIAWLQESRVHGIVTRVPLAPSGEAAEQAAWDRREQAIAELNDLLYPGT